MRRGILAVLGLALLVACGDVEPSAPTPADLRAIDVSPDHTIVVDEDGYEPDALTVDAGDVVLLVNQGEAAHSFTAEGQRFDTGRMEPGDETTLVLTEPGAVDFHDAEVPDHQGTLTVTSRP